MGHLIFLILHVAAFFFGCVGLMITIPLHLIYCAISSGKREKREPMSNKKVVATLFGLIFLFGIVYFMVVTS